MCEVFCFQCFQDSLINSSICKPAAKAKAKKEEPTYTLETVREVLSRKSNIDGGQHRAEVKALVKKYGNGGTLKDVPAEQYAALIAEAEVIGNA